MKNFSSRTHCKFLICTLSWLGTISNASFHSLNRLQLLFSTSEGWWTKSPFPQNPLLFSGSLSSVFLIRYIPIMLFHLQLAGWDSAYEGTAALNSKSLRPVGKELPSAKQQVYLFDWKAVSPSWNFFFLIYVALNISLDVGRGTSFSTYSAIESKNRIKFNCAISFPFTSLPQTNVGNMSSSAFAFNK